MRVKIELDISPELLLDSTLEKEVYDYLKQLIEDGSLYFEILDEVEEVS